MRRALEALGNFLFSVWHEVQSFRSPSAFCGPLRRLLRWHAAWQRSILELVLCLLALTFAFPASAADAPPTARIIGTSLPVPQGFSLHNEKPLIATLQGSGVALTHLETMNVVLRLGKDEPPSSSVAFSNDGELIAVGHEQGVVSVWRLDGRRVTLFKGHLDRIMALAFSPDGQWMASGGYDGTVQVWSTINWRRVVTLDGITRPVSAGAGDNLQAFLGLIFSPDSQALYALESMYEYDTRTQPLKTILSAWQVGSWREAGRLIRGVKAQAINDYANPFAAPFALSTWGGSRIYLAADDGRGDPGAIVPPSLPTLRSLAITDCFPEMNDAMDRPPSNTWPTALAADSSRGWLAAAHLEGLTYEWRPGIVLMPLGHGAPPRSWPTSAQSIQLAFDRKGRLFSLSREGQIIRWDTDVPTLKSTGRISVDRLEAKCHPSEEALTAQTATPGEQKTIVPVVQWLVAPDVMKILNNRNDDDYAETLELSGNRFTLWDIHGRVFLDTSTGNEIDRDPPLAKDEFLIVSRSSTYRLIANSDALFAVEGGTGKRRVVDRKPGWRLIGASIIGEQVATAWKEQSKEAFPAEVIHLLSASSGKLERIIRLAANGNTKGAVPTLFTSIDSPLSLAASPDGDWIGYQISYGEVSDDRTWSIIDTNTGQAMIRKRPLQRIGRSRFLEHDARWMGLAIFDVASGQVEARFRRHVSRVAGTGGKAANRPLFLRAAMSKNGRFVATGAADGSIKIWDADKRTEIASIVGSAGVRVLGFDQLDDTRFYAIYRDGSFHLWQLQDSAQ